MGEALDLVRRCHADLELFAAAAHDDIEWISPREDPDHGTHRGWEEIGRFFAHWVESYPDLDMTVVDYAEHGEKVLAWVRMAGSGSSSGIPVEMELAQVWTIRNGKVLRVEEFFDREEAEAAARE